MNNAKVVRSSWRMMAVLVIAVLGLWAAGCGDSGDSTSNSTTAAPSSTGGTKEAAAYVAAHSKLPASITQTKPVGKAIPTGKKIVYVSCGGEGCIDTSKSFKQAAEFLGWSVTIITPTARTPQAIQQGMDEAVRQKPDAVISTSTEMSTIRRQADKLKAAGIPLISVFGSDPTGGSLTLQIQGIPAAQILAKAAANKAIVDLKGETVTAGAIDLAGFAGVSEFVEAFTSEFKRLCPGCKSKTTTLEATALGTTAGTQIVNFLRSNPDVKTLFLSADQEGADLQTAAKSAAFDVPKTYSIYTSHQGLEATRSGELSATVPADYPVIGWQVADALARIFVGNTAQAVAEDGKPQTPVILAKDLGNVPDAPAGTFPPLVKDYQAQFKTLWNK